MSEEDQNLLDYAYVLVKWRRLIIWSVLITSLVTAGISLLLPKAWTARGIIMPPEEEFDQFNLTSLRSAGMPSSLAGLVGAATPTDHLKTFLELNRIRGAIVDQFDLVAEYGAPHREQAIELLGEKTTVELEREGALLIEVEAPSPHLAADMVNAYIEELDRFNRDLKSQQARKLREFLDDRLRLQRQELEESGRVLLRFRQEHGLVDIEAQTAAVVDVAKAQVQELAMLEAELGVLDHLVGKGHEKRMELELQRDELLKQLRVLVGESQAGPGDLPLGPALKAMPELAFQNAMFELDIRIKEQIALFLGTKLEDARYREHLDTPTLRILDKATPPKVRSAPRRTLMVLVAAALGLVISTVLAFTFESWSRLGVQQQQKLESIRELLRR